MANSRNNILPIPEECRYGKNGRTFISCNSDGNTNRVPAKRWRVGRSARVPEELKWVEYAKNDIDVAIREMEYLRSPRLRPY